MPRPLPALAPIPPLALTPPLSPLELPLLIDPDALADAPLLLPSELPVALLPLAEVEPPVVPEAVPEALVPVPSVEPDTSPALAPVPSAEPAPVADAFVLPSLVDAVPDVPARAVLEAAPGAPEAAPGPAVAAVEPSVALDDVEPASVDGSVESVADAGAALTLPDTPEEAAGAAVLVDDAAGVACEAGCVAAAVVLCCELVTEIGGAPGFPRASVDLNARMSWSTKGPINGGEEVAVVLIETACSVWAASTSLPPAMAIGRSSPA